MIDTIYERLLQFLFVLYSIQFRLEKKINGGG